MQITNAKLSLVERSDPYVGSSNATAPDSVLQHEAAPPRLRFKTATVRRACAFLELRLGEKITLGQLAGHVRIGRASMVRSFKAQMGLTPFQYLLRIRLARAVDLLATGMRGAAVAHEVGFCDQSLLCRQFRRVHGVTPSAFLRAMQRR